MPVQHKFYCRKMRKWIIYLLKVILLFSSLFLIYLMFLERDSNEENNAALTSLQNLHIRIDVHSNTNVQFRQASRTAKVMIWNFMAENSSIVDAIFAQNERALFWKDSSNEINTSFHPVTDERRQDLQTIDDRRITDIKGLFSCKLNSMSTEFLLNRNLFTEKPLHKTLDLYISCLVYNHVTEFSQELCWKDSGKMSTTNLSAAMNVGKEGEANSLLKGLKSQAANETYKKCMTDLYHIYQSCEPVLQSACDVSDIIAMSTKATLKDYEIVIRLLNDVPDLHHLFLLPNTSGVYRDGAIWSKGGVMLQNNPTAYRRRIMQVNYDIFQRNPIEWEKNLYSFIQMPLPRM